MIIQTGGISVDRTINVLLFGTFHSETFGAGMKEITADLFQIISVLLSWRMGELRTLTNGKANIGARIITQIHAHTYDTYIIECVIGDRKVLRQCLWEDDLDL